MPLTEDEKRKIIGTEDFNRFVDKSSRIIERALTETCDIFTDYTGGDRDDQERYYKTHWLLQEFI